MAQNASVALPTRHFTQPSGHHLGCICAALLELGSGAGQQWDGGGTGSLSMASAAAVEHTELNPNPSVTKSPILPGFALILGRIGNN